MTQPGSWLQKIPKAERQQCALDLEHLRREVRMDTLQEALSAIADKNPATGDEVVFLLYQKLWKEGAR